VTIVWIVVECGMLLLKIGPWSVVS
jgi:hypothetical protein